MQAVGACGSSVAVSVVDDTCGNDEWREGTPPEADVAGGNHSRFRLRSGHYCADSARAREASIAFSIVGLKSVTTGISASSPSISATKSGSKNPCLT